MIRYSYYILGENEVRKAMEIILCVFIIIFLSGIFAITFQVIGEDSTNKSTIIGGILSMLGGAIGAFGAYFVARMQMTKQLDLQYNKEREKMIVEIKINKFQELLLTYENSLQKLDYMYLTILDNVSRIRLPSSSTGDVRKYEMNIRLQLVEISMNLSKVKAFMSYFEEEDIISIPNFKEVTSEFADGIYDIIISAQTNRYSINSSKDELSMDIDTYEERIQEILNKPYEEVLTMVELIQQKINQLIRT